MGLQYVQMGEKQGLLPIHGQNQCRQLTFAVKMCFFKDAFTAEPVQRLQDSRQQCWTRMCGMNAAGQTYLHQKPARFYLPLPSKAEKTNGTIRGRRWKFKKIEMYAQPLCFNVTFNRENLQWNLEYGHSAK